MGRIVLPPFLVHVAGAPGADGQQRCVPCGVVLLDARPQLEGRAMIPDGQPYDGPSWWPPGALVATDKVEGSREPSMTYVVDQARGLADDERPCVEPAR